MKPLVTMLVARLLAAAPEAGTTPSLDAAQASAESALQAARTAAASKKQLPPLAKEKLTAAEELCRQKKFRECAQAADEAWKLSAEKVEEPTRFAVEVHQDGSTQVRSQSGKPVQVAAQGVTRPVYAGQAVAVTQGKAPSAPQTVPAVPVLVKPETDEKLRLKPSRKGLGPVLLTWSAVPGASAYEVRVEGKESPLFFASKSASVQLPPLPPGSYRWAVRSVVAANLKSDLSEQRAFELIEDPLKLEVKGGEWK